MARLFRVRSGFAWPALCLMLSACGGQTNQSDEAAIANQAESLERAANATSDQLIRQIEESARAEAAAASQVAPQEVKNQTE